MLLDEGATAISVTASSGFASVSWLCICGAPFCSSSSAGFFLLLGGMEGFDDDKRRW
jgi:hypothetical protein